MSKSCATPGQEPAAFGTWPVNVLSARQAVQRHCSYVSGSSEEATQGPVADAEFTILDAVPLLGAGTC